MTASILNGNSRNSDDGSGDDGSSHNSDGDNSGDGSRRDSNRCGRNVSWRFFDLAVC